MAFQVRLTKAALIDFEEILSYSWAMFPDSAERFGNALLDHLEILKKFPYIGSRVSGRPGIRQLAHTPITIYYRVHEDSESIAILHFWHGARQKPPRREKDSKAQ
ncbi:MAG TPA: type II toxin-antitoxin system RelE/ParE family toxin [Terriglobales bacterium]|nr:type II toxin-antitoxin system RelE/ParE family toxin [Terriglobales bacterium]